jgi:hypothetical protein
MSQSLQDPESPKNLNDKKVALFSIIGIGISIILLIILGLYFYSQNTSQKSNSNNSVNSSSTINSSSIMSTQSIQSSNRSDTTSSQSNVSSSSQSNNTLSSSSSISSISPSSSSVASIQQTGPEYVDFTYTISTRDSILYCLNNLDLVTDRDNFVTEGRTDSGVSYFTHLDTIRTIPVGFYTFRQYIVASGGDNLPNDYYTCRYQNFNNGSVLFSKQLELKANNRYDINFKAYSNEFKFIENKR